MNILFLGSGAFGLPTLERLAKSSAHRIVGVVTQPDRPAGRGGKLTPTPIGASAAAGLPGVPLLKPEDINEPGTLAAVRGLAGPGRPRGAGGADAWVVIAFGQKLSPALLDGTFAINLHASLLPRWRGAAPIAAAMLAGDETVGNTVITLAQRMDAGLILGRTERPVPLALTAGEMHDLLALDGPELVEDVLARHAAGRAIGEAQDESLVTRARKLSKADGWVDFSQPAKACRERVHALNPWPGVTVRFQGGPLKILRVHEVPGLPLLPPAPQERLLEPGTIYDAAMGRVACGPGGDGVGTGLLLMEVQPPGGRGMNWQDFARGRTIREGEMVTGGVPRP